MRGSSIRRPPISEPLVFIHAGALHGEPITFRRGLSASAWRSSGYPASPTLKRPLDAADTIAGRVNTEVFITCAVTGAGDTTLSSERVPVTPQQIAESAIEAARAGAAVVHIHVRDPETGRGSRDVALYREAVERVRAADVDAVVNLTAGMGATSCSAASTRRSP